MTHHLSWTKDRIAAEIKSGKRSVVLRTKSGQFVDLRDVSKFDDLPYQVQTTDHEVVVVDRPRKGTKPDTSTRNTTEGRTVNWRIQ